MSVPPDLRDDAPKRPAPRAKGQKRERAPKPGAVLPNEPREPQGRKWTHLLGEEIEYGDKTASRGTHIVLLVRNRVPMQVAARILGLAVSTYHHVMRLATLAVERWGYEGALVTERYGPLVRFAEAVDQARAEGIGALVLAWGAGAMRDPRTARDMLLELAPEHFGSRRHANEEDAPAASVPQLGAGETPIRVFMPPEEALLPGEAAPASGRVVPIRGGVVLEESDDFEGEVIVAEGRSVG